MKQLIFALCLMVQLSLSHAELSFKDTHGQDIVFSSLKGKWVVINYWAQWCDTCIAEIPELNKFYQSHLHDSVVFLSVNYDALPHKKLSYLAKKLDIRFPILLKDPNETLHLDTIQAIPATFIMNPDGQLVKRFYGEVSVAKLNAFINKENI